MKITEVRCRDVEVGIQCDICGRQSRVDGSPTPEFANLSVLWGYYSAAGGERHDCDICEGCYDRVRAFIESIGGEIRVEDV